MTSSATDAVALTAALVRCPSVTPEEGGALELLAGILEAEGFGCWRVDRNDVPNLFARAGSGSPSIGFAGHTDVVPVGDRELWSADPFGGEIRDGFLWGRGSVDMKSGVAAFVAAANRKLRSGTAAGSIALLITGDEEGLATDGTRAIVDWMQANGETLDGAIVGEPTSKERVGDTIKIGRRGSASFRILATGHAGHSAYPERARNPVPEMARLAVDLSAIELDSGTAEFQPSTLTVTSIETGNPASNVIPATTRALVSLRFNDLHSISGLEALLRERIEKVEALSGIEFSLETLASAEAFLVPPGPMVETAAAAAREIAGVDPDLSTTGGTSDARFVKELCPVLELGLVGRRMHETDERVPVADIELLERLYGAVLDRALTGERR